jgi:heavy metal sensor kinase
MRSLRARLTVWSVLVLAAIVVALGAFVTLRLRSDLVQRVDRSLDAGAVVIGRAFDKEGPIEFRNTSGAVLGAFPYQPAASQILDLQGYVVAFHGAGARQPMLHGPDLESALSGTHLLVDRNLGGQPFRLWAREIDTRRGNYVLAIAQSLRSVDDSVATLISQLAIGGIGALLAAGLAGWWLARRALRPVAEMTSAADRITVDRMSERVAEPGSRDELGRLAATLNRMLDRVEQGVEDKRRLVADASHELRTPLAVMRSELDVSLREGELDGEARTVLESAREEVDRMTRIVENLLTLARVDEGRLRLLASPIELRELLDAAIEPLRGVAAARGVEVALAPGEVEAQGDPELLRQVASNLIDNAIKYGGAGGCVDVRAWSADGEAGATVADSGPGIPAGAQARVFDRFYRVDAARGREGGSGLGLAICKEIVRAHGGRIWVENGDGGGSSFSFAVPAARPADA